MDKFKKVIAVVIMAFFGAFCLFAVWQVALIFPVLAIGTVIVFVCGLAIDWASRQLG
jgi:hypothetical protein